MDKRYEVIDHTADIGIRARGDNLKGLFKNTALAMFDVIAERKPETRKQRRETINITIKQKADNLEELFVNWLNELLSLSAIKDLIFYDFKITKLDETVLEAIAVGSDIKNYRINTEIKAATYHELEIKKNDTWQAKVIFDV